MTRPRGSCGGEKHRDEKPFAVMCRDLDCARRLCEVSEAEARALESFRRPIVLLKKRRRGTYMHLSENDYIGVMLPYTPLHVLLFGRGYRLHGYDEREPLGYAYRI